MFSEDRPLTPRFVIAHIKYLPMGSAFIAEQRGGQQFRGWDQSQYMTATLIDAVRTLTYAFVLAHVDPDKTRPKPPAQYPVPDKVKVQTAEDPGSFSFIVKMHLAAIKKKKREGGRSCQEPVPEETK